MSKMERVYEEQRELFDELSGMDSVVEEIKNLIDESEKEESDFHEKVCDYSDDFIWVDNRADYLRKKYPTYYDFTKSVLIRWEGDVRFAPNMWEVSSKMVCETLEFMAEQKGMFNSLYEPVSKEEEM